MDYEIEFELKDDGQNLDLITSRVIAIAERTGASVGGGGDKRKGEFYIDSGKRFRYSDLLEMLAVLMPNATSVTVNTVSGVNKGKGARAKSSVTRRKHLSRQKQGIALAGTEKRKLKARARASE
jgi:hypothetical protein